VRALEQHAAGQAQLIPQMVAPGEARSVTPEPMRPGWADALRMSRSVLPHQRLVGLDERLHHAAARPVIVPETIVVDHGMVYCPRRSTPPAARWA